MNSFDFYSVFLGYFKNHYSLQQEIFEIHTWRFYHSGSLASVPVFLSLFLSTLVRNGGYAFQWVFLQLVPQWILDLQWLLDSDLLLVDTSITVDWFICYFIILFWNCYGKRCRLGRICLCLMSPFYDIL